MDSIHRLEIGVVICLTDPHIILSTNGTFRFLENGLRSSLKVGEIVLFEELPSEECDYINLSNCFGFKTKHWRICQVLKLRNKKEIVVEI